MKITATKIRWFICGLIILIAWYFCLPILRGPVRHPIRDLLLLPFGWWHFLQVNLSQMTWNWTLIATGLLCTALILWLGQWTLSALYAQVQLARQPDQPVRRWPWRRTVCGYLAVWLMFAITFGASGLFRHVTWLLTDKQPMYQSNREAETAYFKILSVANIVETSLFDSANNVEQVRAKLDSKLMENGSKPVEEDFDLTFFGNASKKVEKVVIISRDLHLLSSPKFLLMDASGKYDGNAMSNLTQTLSGLDAKYPIKR